MRAGALRRLPAATTLALGALLSSVPLPVAGQSITVVSWGGSYGRAVNEGANIPFTEATGVRIGVEAYNGGLAQIRAQVEIGSIHWDVVDLEMADAVRGCDEGLLEPMDIDDLPPGPDGTPAADDFVAGTLTECGVGNLYWSTVYAYNDENFVGERPATMADFFDLERFPGRRGMRRVPQVNLEFALIADGVPLDEVYATMETPQGLDRAFAKLETIKDEVVWWEAGAQPPQMLADREVVMSTAYNGRIFNAQILEDQPFVIVWDGQLLDVGQVGIVAGTPRLEEALRYVAFSHQRRVPGANRPPHLLLPGAQIGRAAGDDPCGRGDRHGAPHAGQRGQRGSRAALRLGVLGRQPGRAERALQRMAGALAGDGGRTKANVRARQNTIR